MLYPFTTGWTKVHLPNNLAVRFQADLEPIDDYQTFLVNGIRFWFSDNDILSTEFDNELCPEDDIIAVKLDLFRLRNAPAYQWSLDNWLKLIKLESKEVVDLYYGVINQDWSGINQAIVKQLISMGV